MDFITGVMGHDDLLVMTCRVGILGTRSMTGVRVAGSLPVMVLKSLSSYFASGSWQSAPFGPWRSSWCPAQTPFFFATSVDHLVHVMQIKNSAYGNKRNIKWHKTNKIEWINTVKTLVINFKLWSFMNMYFGYN